MKKLLFIPLLLGATSLLAQSLNPDYVAYIEKYKLAAVEQERIHHIPACITLAQGLLESGAGKSELSREANNHFGIKCHKDWTGETYTHDDETKNECFRKYDDAAQSFDDHALFLLRPRYQSLFALDIRDYKGWAKGLKECGYATDANYANKLIKIIEDYELVAVADAVSLTNNEELLAAEAKAKEEAAAAAAAAASATTEPAATAASDKKASKSSKKSSSKKSSSKAGKTSKTAKAEQAKAVVDEAFAQTEQVETVEQVGSKPKAQKRNPAQVASVDLYLGHVVYKQGCKRYVIANAGDTYRGIAAEFNVELRRVLRYNNVSSEYAKPQQGERVYLTGKKK